MKPIGITVEADVSLMHKAVVPSRITLSVIKARSAGSLSRSAASNQTNADAAANATAAWGRSLVGLDDSLLTPYITRGIRRTILNRFCARLPLPRQSRAALIATVMSQMNR